MREADRWRERLRTYDGRRRVAITFVAVVGASLVLGLLAGMCWGGSPEPPLEALGLGRVGTEEPAEPDTMEGTAMDEELDAEQQAFAERRERELSSRQSESEPGSTVPDFTDHALIQELAGNWRLDLGRGRRGYRVRFGSDSVRTVHRQRFDMTLFDAVGRGLPPYFTVLDLPDGKLLAFLDTAGTFRLVLEDVRREADGRLSWRGPSRARRYGIRLDGDSSWRFGRERKERSAPDAERQAGVESAVPETETVTPRRPRVQVRTLPGPVPEGLRARLYTRVERHLDELAFGLMERDVDRVFALWAGRPDEATRSSVEELLESYASMRVWTRLLVLEIVPTDEGPEAHFAAVVTVQGAPAAARHRRDVDLRDIRWQGRLVLEGDVGVQLDPFPG